MCGKYVNGCELNSTIQAVRQGKQPSSHQTLEIMVMSLEKQELDGDIISLESGWLDLKTGADREFTYCKSARTNV